MAGTYKQQISVTKKLPGCVLVLVDQSKSMEEKFGRDDRPKSVAVARAVNTALDQLVTDCTFGETVRDYIHVGVVGYGRRVSEPLSGGTAPAGLLTVSELEKCASQETVERDDGTGSLFPIQMNKWFDPVADDGTPMAEALQLATQKLQGWVKEYPNSLPPVVLNITDGKPNDEAAAELAAQALRSVSTADGDTLLFSCHVSENPASPIFFPTCDEGLPDEFAKFLFRISSELPQRFIDLGKIRKLPMQDRSRGFIFNADAAALVKFLRIGTVLTQTLDR